MRFDPATYPGPRPDGPVLVERGEVHPLAVDGDVASPWRRVDGGPTPAAGDLRLCVAYGANASPPRLLDKGLDARGAVVLPARMVGWVPAFEARRTGYGSVPLTLVPSDDPQLVLDTWVLGVHEADLSVLDVSEGRVPAGTTPEGPEDANRGRPGSYALGRIGPVAVADRFVLEDALAYRPGGGSRLLAGPDGWLPWPAHDQADASAALDAGTPAVAPGAVGRIVHGPWPDRTPLRDPPLLAYGTLRPDGDAFGLVADLVEVVGPASAPGRLHDTPHGWPAACLEGDDRFEGVLLSPRGPSEARTLLERSDRYEGAPGLFRRVAVPVRCADADTAWALTYVWAHGRPDGPVLAGGRWPA